MRGLNRVLHDTWNSAAGTTERDHLRALHDHANLLALAQELNRSVLPRGFSIKLSSLWVDWQPQSWKWISSRNSFDKPSVEIADLLVVVWDDALCLSGKALVLAAKMGDAPKQFALSGKSTKKEITFLESPYKFMLSNSMSGTPRPLTGFTRSDCEFDFSASGGLDHWRWMVIRKNNATAWLPPVVRHTVKTSAAAATSHSFSRMLLSTILQPGGSFHSLCNCSEWCRLVNLLLGHTGNTTYHPKALGPARIDAFMSAAGVASPGNPGNCSWISLSLPSSISVDFIRDLNVPKNYMSRLFDDEGREGIFERFHDVPHPQCPILFITKREKPPFIGI